MHIGARIHHYARRNLLGEVHAAETGFILRTPHGESVLAQDDDAKPRSQARTGFMRPVRELWD